MLKLGMCSFATERALAFPCDTLIPGSDVRSRLVVKLRVDLPTTGVGARMRRTVLAWGDLFMMRKQLLTLKALAEKSAT